MIDQPADAAHHYIETHHLELIPTITGTKRPRFKTGINHAECAVTTVDAIGDWWSDGRTGIALSGRRNRLAAVDVDGREGFDKWAELEAIFGTLPITWGLSSNRPDSDRVTFVYRWPDDIEVSTSNKVAGCRKLERKAASSIFVLPPSTHPTGAIYTWLQGVSCCEIELAILPEWMATIGTSE